MKLKINRKLKSGLISILTILIALSTYLLYKEVNYLRFEEQKNPVYTYSNKGSINYTVFLKPNNLYEGSSLDEGKLYIAEFVDYIRTTFIYEFSGEREAELKGTYEIVAKVQGFTGEGEKLKNIWDKNFVIVGQKSFSIVGNSKTIKEEIKLSLNQFNTFVDELFEASKINSQTMLTLAMDIKLSGTTDKGPIEETISPFLIIPLDTALFEISGDTILDKPGVIEETVQVQLPVNTKQVLLYGIIIGILSLAVIFLIFIIKTAPNKEPLEKELKKIFKKHGDRLVALNSDLSITNDVKLVRSIDDLVKIADEIGKPILYKYSENYKEINKFYVNNLDDIYVFDLNDIFHVELIQNVEVIKETDTIEEIEIEA